MLLIASIYKRYVTKHKCFTQIHLQHLHIISAPYCLFTHCSNYSQCESIKTTINLTDLWICLLPGVLSILLYADPTEEEKVSFSTHLTDVRDNRCPESAETLQTRLCFQRVNLRTMFLKGRHHLCLVPMQGRSYPEHHGQICWKWHPSEELGIWILCCM